MICANSALISFTARNRPGLMTGRVDDHKPQVGMLTIRVAPVQKPNVRWKGRPIDICLSSCHLHSRKDSRTEIRQTHWRLDRFFHRYEWHWPGRRRVCLREVTPLENVNGRNAKRVTATRKMWGINQNLVLGDYGKGF